MPTRVNTTVTLAPEGWDCGCAEGVPCAETCYYVLGEQSYLAIDLPDYGPFRTIPLNLFALTSSGDITNCTGAITRWARQWLCNTYYGDGFYYVDTVSHPIDPSNWMQAVPGTLGYYTPATYAGIGIDLSGQVFINAVIQIERFNEYIENPGEDARRKCGVAGTGFPFADLTRIVRLTTQLAPGLPGWPQDCPDFATGPGAPVVELIPGFNGESPGTVVIGSAWVTTNPNATPTPVTYSNPTWTVGCASTTFCITINGGSLGQLHTLSITGDWVSSGQPNPPGSPIATRTASRRGPGTLCVCFPYDVPVIRGASPPEIDLLDFSATISTYRGSVLITSTQTWTQADTFGVTYCPSPNYKGPGWYCVGLGPNGEFSSVDPPAIGCVFIDLGTFSYGCAALEGSEEIDLILLAIVNGPHEPPMNDECRSEYLITYPDGSAEFVQEFCFVPEGV